MHQDSSSKQTLLLIGASRGLGYAMVGEFLARRWNVVGTVRGSARTPLHDLADANPDRVEVETLDVNSPDQLDALHSRLVGRRFDMLFVNAGVTNHGGTDTPIAGVSTAEFIRVMTTNALSPMRVIERLEPLVSPAGLIGAMSSGRGSVSNNESGQEELYRGSKAALNMFMRSFAARRATDSRALVLMAPGWVRTEMGGPDARLTIEDSIPNVVNTLLGALGRPGLRYLDYLGRTVPW